MSVPSHRSNRDLFGGARHPCSLMPSGVHDPELLSLLRDPVNLDVISYICDEAKSAIQIVLREDGTPVQGQLPISLKQFIIVLVKAANVQMTTLLVTVIYLRRLKKKLPSMASGIPSARHRVFLATLVLASKYINDSHPKNGHWAQHNSIFGVHEINLMERQLVSLLGFDLRFDEAEAREAFAPLLRTTNPSSLKSKTAAEVIARAEAVCKVSKACKARAVAQARVTPHSSSTETVASASIAVPRPKLLSSSSSSTEYSTISSASSIDMSSLVSDNGSSSCSSSECATESESEQEPISTQPVHKFSLRARRRKVSDVTITCSPKERRVSGSHRSTSGAHRGTLPVYVVPASATLPNISRSGASGGFLSRMWGAALAGKSTENAGVISITEASDTQDHNVSTFRRLALSSSRIRARVVEP